MGRVGLWFLIGLSMVTIGPRMFRIMLSCVSSSDLAPLVVMNSGSSVPTGLTGLRG
jgi:hypothetical protein